MGRKRTFFVRPGQRFGRLTVVEERPRERPGRSALWEALCTCECGGQTAVLLQALKDGLTQSCGCMRKRGTLSEKRRACRTRPRKYTVEMGERFGKLTVIREFRHETPGGYFVWRAVCQCDCGAQVSPLVKSLREQIIRSCRGLRREYPPRNSVEFRGGSAGPASVDCLDVPAVRADGAAVGVEDDLVEDLVAYDELDYLSPAATA